MHAHAEARHVRAITAVVAIWLSMMFAGVCWSRAQETNTAHAYAHVRSGAPQHESTWTETWSDDSGATTMRQMHISENIAYKYAAAAPRNTTTLVR